MVYPMQTFKDTGSATQNVKGDRLKVRYQNDEECLCWKKSRTGSNLFLKDSAIIVDRVLSLLCCRRKQPRSGGRGWGRSQFRRGDIYCGTLYINVVIRLHSGPLSRLSLDQSPVEVTDGGGGGSGAESQRLCKECPPPQKKKLSLVPICDWRGGEVVAIKETVSSVIIVKKIRQNCTLHHVVNKPVWADIDAASTRSTNILVLRTS